MGFECSGVLLKLYSWHRRFILTSIVLFRDTNKLFHVITLHDRRPGFFASLSTPKKSFFADYIACHLATCELFVRVQLRIFVWQYLT